MAPVITFIGTAFSAVFGGGTLAAGIVGVAQAATVGAICGAVVGAVNAAIQGGSIWKGALTGAVIGGVTAGAIQWASTAMGGGAGAGAEMGEVGVGEVGVGEVGVESVAPGAGGTMNMNMPSGWGPEVAAAEKFSGGVTVGERVTMNAPTGWDVPMTPIETEAMKRSAETTLGGGGGGTQGGFSGWISENPVPAMLLGNSLSQGAGAILQGQENKEAMELALERSRLEIDANKVRDLSLLDLNVVIPTVDSLKNRPEWSWNKEAGILGGA